MLVVFVDFVVGFVVFDGVFDGVLFVVMFGVPPPPLLVGAARWREKGGSKGSNWFKLVQIFKFYSNIQIFKYSNVQMFKR